MVSIFGAFGRKTLIDAPEIGVFGQFDPLNGLQILTKAKIRHMLAWVHVIWTIKSENVCELLKKYK